MEKVEMGEKLKRVVGKEQDKIIKNCDRSSDSRK
jgi:hypothetical protein